MKDFMESKKESCANMIPLDGILTLASAKFRIYSIKMIAIRKAFF